MAEGVPFGYHWRNRPLVGRCRSQGLHPPDMRITWDNGPVLIPDPALVSQAEGGSGLVLEKGFRVVPGALSPLWGERLNAGEGAALGARLVAAPQPPLLNKMPTGGLGLDWRLWCGRQEILPNQSRRRELGLGRRLRCGRLPGATHLLILPVPVPDQIGRQWLLRWPNRRRWLTAWRGWVTATAADVARGDHGQAVAA